MHTFVNAAREIAFTLGTKIRQLVRLDRYVYLFVNLFNASLHDVCASTQRIKYC